MVNVERPAQEAAQSHDRQRVPAGLAAEHDRDGHDDDFFDDSGVDAGDRAAYPGHRIRYDPAAGRVGVAGAQGVEDEPTEDVAAAEHDGGDQRRHW